METTPDLPSTPWLEQLERRVQQAVDEIARLRQENRRLERELGKLRKQQEGSDGAATWRHERDEVRARVERLATHLEELLGEGSAAAAPPAPPAG